MDKYEYKLRSDEIVKLIEEEKYVEAAKEHYDVVEGISSLQSQQTK